MFSRPQVIENSRQCLLLRRDILQKTVRPSFQAGFIASLRQGKRFFFLFLPFCYCSTDKLRGSLVSSFLLPLR